MIKTTVSAVNRFAEVTALVEQRVRVATQAAAEEAARVARDDGAARHCVDVEVIPVHGTENGYGAGIKGRWYYRFQSYGTLGRALNPKRPGTQRSHAPGTGVEPNRMWQNARAAGRRHLRAALTR